MGEVIFCGDWTRRAFWKNRRFRRPRLRMKERERRNDHRASTNVGKHRFMRRDHEVREQDAAEIAVCSEAQQFER